MMIKNALSVLPTRPVLYIVPVIVVGVLWFYYQTQYTKCTNIKQSRTSLTETLHSMSVSEKIRLAEFTDFIWDKVRIVASVKPGERNAECPFGWNWAGGERESLMAAGLLTVMMFGQKDEIVGYIELRNDEVEFRGTDSSLTPETAIFSVGRNSSNSSGISLTLNQ